jgi:hypothetical protein
VQNNRQHEQQQPTEWSFTALDWVVFAHRHQLTFVVFGAAMKRALW